MKVDINDILSEDFQDIIVTKELKRVHGYMEEYLERYKEKDHGFVAIFSTNKDVNFVNASMAAVILSCRSRALALPIDLTIDFTIRCKLESAISSSILAPETHEEPAIIEAVAFSVKHRPLIFIICSKTTPIPPWS